MPVDMVLEGRLVNLLYIFALSVVIWAVATHGIPSLVRLFGLQSFLLACGSALMAHMTGVRHIYFASIFTIIFKVILIPIVLLYVMKRLRIKKEIETYFNVPSSLILCSILTIVAYVATLRIVHPKGAFNVQGVFAVAVSIMLIGFFIMVNRKNAIMQVIGLMFMENGVFLAAIAMTYGMPLLIEFGIFFDVFVGILIMGIILFKISAAMPEFDFREDEI